MIKQLIAILLFALSAQAQLPNQQSLFVGPIRKAITNQVEINWEQQPNTYIRSNRVTFSNPYLINRFWFGNVNDVFFSLVRTQGQPRWTITVASLGLTLTGESKPVTWPPFPLTNWVLTVLAQQFAGSGWSGMGSVFSGTNLPGAGYFRLWYMPTNQTWTQPMWVVQRSGDLFHWTNQSMFFIAPESTKFRLSVSNWGY